MFSRPVFKQNLKAHYKLWLIITALLCVIISITIATYDPKMFSRMMDMMENMPNAGRFTARMSEMTSLLGMISNGFYTMIGVVLPLIFTIATANSLVASQIDRGSMAYLLSTPVKRSTVVRTQAATLILSILLMFAVVSGVGYASVEVFQSAPAYTRDVRAAARVLGMDRDEVAEDLGAILASPDALAAGARARRVDEEVYTAYLNQKIASQNGETPQPSMSMPGMEGIPGMESMAEEIQNRLLSGFDAAAEALETDVTELMENLARMKRSDEALAAAEAASGIPQAMFVTAINQELAAQELLLDKGVDIDVKAFLMLNLGCFLLLFATSGVSFLFSCVFNLSKHSIALGAGLPIAFLIAKMVSQISESLSGFKYVSLNTLFDTEAILAGSGYALSFAVLAAVGIVLYALGSRIFVEKDLPL